MWQNKFETQWEQDILTLLKKKIVVSRLKATIAKAVHAGT